MQLLLNPLLHSVTCSIKVLTETEACLGTGRSIVTRLFRTKSSAFLVFYLGCVTKLGCYASCTFRSALLTAESFSASPTFPLTMNCICGTSAPYSNSGSGEGKFRTKTSHFYLRRSCPIRIRERQILVKSTTLEVYKEQVFQVDIFPPNCTAYYVVLVLLLFLHSFIHSLCNPSLSLYFCLFLWHGPPRYTKTAKTPSL